MPPIFSIFTPSRHPANQIGYVASTHRYRSDYVNPSGWILNLDASPGLPKSKNGNVEVPSNITSFQWVVRQAQGGFSKTVMKDRTKSEMWKAEVEIPQPGQYDITLQVNLTNGQKQIGARAYRLRDFLIVSIGDSFAAGQGNPDIPAIPSPDEKVFCEATTILLAITKLKELVITFAKQLDKEAKQKIEDFLPFVGKIVVAELNGVEDAVGFVARGILSLGNIIVGVVKTIDAAVVEGAEVVLDIFGVGDGGEAEETRPRQARWQEPNAYRSYRSGHSLAAGQIESENEFGADRITFLSFARTGSEIQDGLLGPRKVDANIIGSALPSVSIDSWIGNRGQVQEAKETLLGRPINALIITIGVNDLDFSSSVTKSIIWTSADKRQMRIDETQEKLRDQLPRDFNSLKKAIDTQLKPRQVFITEYPAGLFTKLVNGQVKDGGPCGVLSSTNIPGTSIGFDLDLEDGKALRRLGKQMNQVIRTKADEFGWTFIGDIEQAFDGHGYCASQSYFVSAEESCLKQGDFEGMLHPNKKGHQTTRDCIARVLRREMLGPQENWLEPILNIMMS